MRSFFSARSAFVFLVLGILAYVRSLPPYVILGSRVMNLLEQVGAWRAFAAANLRAGHFPLWNPWTFAGQPFLGGFESELLYPINLIYLVLPLPRALNLSLLLHLAILGFGMRRWAVRNELHPAAAAFAGLAAALGGAGLAYLAGGDLSTLSTLAWVPWIFDGLENWLRQGQRRGVIQASLAVCLQVFAGHVHFAIFTSAAAGLLTALRASEDSQASRRAIPGWIGCYVLAAGLAAIQLLPGLAALGESVRQSPTHEFTSIFSFQAPPKFGPAGGPGVARSLLIAAGLLGLGGGALCIAMRRPFTRLLLLVFVPLELVVFAGSNLALFPSGDIMPSELPSFVADRPGDYRVFNFGRSNSGYLLGRPDIGGGNAGASKRYAEFMTFTQGGDPNQADQKLEIRFWHPLYALIRQRYSFTPTQAGLSVVEAPTILPHAYLVSKYVVRKNRDAIFAALTDPGFDPRETVVLEKEPLVVPRAGGARMDVRISRETTDEFVVEVTTDCPAILVVTDLYSKDWQASPLPSSEQTAYEVMPADYIIRGVPLKAGHHMLLIKYRPAFFYTGMGISVFAWLGVTGGWLWTARRRSNKMSLG